MTQRSISTLKFLKESHLKLSFFLYTSQMNAQNGNKFKTFQVQSMVRGVWTLGVGQPSIVPLSQQIV